MWLGAMLTTGRWARRDVWQDSRIESVDGVVCCALPRGRAVRTHDIFECTEQIQQLVISRAIFGMRVG